MLLLKKWVQQPLKHRHIGYKVGSMAGVVSSCNGHWMMSSKVINNPYWFLFCLINNVITNIRENKCFSKTSKSPVFSWVWLQIFLFKLSCICLFHRPICQTLNYLPFFSATLMVLWVSDACAIPDESSQCSRGTISFWLSRTSEHLIDFCYKCWHSAAKGERGKKEKSLRAFKAHRPFSALISISRDLLV